MMMLTPIPKRTCLRFFVGFSISFCLHRAWGGAPTVLPTPDALACRLAQVYCHLNSAKRVGRAYLQCLPPAADPAWLIETLCAAQGHTTVALMQASPQQLREFVQHQIQQDFAHDRIVNLEGWILAETEVRLCALAALT